MSDAWALPGSGEQWVSDYERGRPGYPARVVAIPSIGRAATVVEVGAGTGKLTRLLVPAFERVIAVEPETAMRRALEALCPGVEAVEGTAEAIPLPDASADAVFAAESFHRFDGPRAVAQIARLLRPRGALVAMWNLPAGPWEPSIADVEDLLMSRIPAHTKLTYDPLDLNTETYASGEWRRAFSGSSFGPLQRATVANPQRLGRDDLVAFFASMGWLADLAETQRLQLLDEVRSLLQNGEYRRMWETHVYWTRLTAAVG